MNQTHPARTFAYAAHLGQKYGEANYITHLDHAVDVLLRFGTPEFSTDFYEVISATYLHDVIEDTRVTRDDLTAVFGIRVALLVDAVTDMPGKNRRERHEKTYPRIRAAGPGAIMVKLADRIANVETSARGPNQGKLDMYRKEYKDFREALFLSHAFGGNEVLDAMWRHLDILLGWKEPA